MWGSFPRSPSRSRLGHPSRALLTLTLALFACLTQPAPAQPPPPFPSDTILEIQPSPAAGVFSLWLDNGLRIHIRPMPGTGKLFVAATVVGGEVLETNAQRGFTQAAANAWTRDGTPPDVLLARAATPEGLWLRAAGPAASAQSMLDQVSAMLSRPSIDPARLEAWKGQARLAVSRRGRSAQTVANDAALAALLPADRLTAALETLDQVDAITPAGAQAWLAERAATGPIEVAIVGDLSLDTALQAAAHSFGAASGIAARERPGPSALRGIRDLRDAIRQTGPTRTQLTFQPDAGAPARSLVALAFRTPDLADLNAARALSAVMDIAATRAEPRLHEAGFPTASVRAQSLPGRLYLGSGLSMLSASLAASEGQPAGPPAAGHEPEALAILQRTLDELAATGPTEAELREEAATRARDARARLNEAEYWSAILTFTTTNGLPIDGLAAAATTYDQLTPDAARAVLRRLWVPAARIELTVLPAAR
ncbi:MAG: M16 family metallopeptidase [Phycisphaerales bacterium]